jgi:GNAT superfamily N-acetyltransferase
MIPNSHHVTIELLSPAMIPENVALAHEVGWPDDDADWRVIHEAGFVLGARRDGRLIGQGVLGSYEPHAGTIAKMIVAPGAQRQGIGARILDALVTEAERRRLTTLGLVATPFGQPLYASRGFVVTGEVAVFIGAPVSAGMSEPMPAVVDVETAVAFEQRFVTCSRAAMLRGRHREASATAICRAPDGAVQGFALATAKGPYALVGPVIAASEGVARTLTRAVFAANPGIVRIDVPGEQTSFRAWLRGLGLPEKGARSEMAWGGALPWQVPQRFALATQAWG